MVNFSLREKIVIKSVLAGGDIYSRLGKLELNNHEALMSLSDGGYILSNHQSNFDLVSLGYSVWSGLSDSSKCFGVGKMGLKKWYMLGSSPHIVPVMRGKDKKKLIKSGVYKTREEVNLFGDKYNSLAFEKAKELVDDKHVLIMFPQGERVFDGSVVSFKKNKLVNWITDSSKPVVLSNIEYCDKKTIITHSDPINFDCLDGIIEESIKFYSSFKK